MDKHALCIGINDYPGTGSDLSGCVNDANDWAAALQKRGFAMTRMFNNKATGGAIRDAISATLGAADAGDLVAITYSGHGSFVPDEDGDEPDGTDECICPYDISRNGPITDDELFDLYSRRRQGVRLLVISDSCHSGSVAKFAPIRTPPTTTARRSPVRKVRFLPPGTFLSTRAAARLGAARPAQLEPTGTVRRAAHGRVPGHRVFLRRLVPGPGERRIHVRRAAGAQGAAGAGHLPGLVRGHPPRSPVAAVPAVTEPVRLLAHEALAGAGLREEAHKWRSGRNWQTWTSNR